MDTLYIPQSDEQEDIDIWAWEPYALDYPHVFELDFS